MIDKDIVAVSVDTNVKNYGLVSINVTFDFSTVELNYNSDSNIKSPPAEIIKFPSQKT